MQVPALRAHSASSLRCAAVLPRQHRITRTSRLALAPRGVHKRGAIFYIGRTMETRPSVFGRLLAPITLIVVSLAVLFPSQAPAADCGGGLNHFQHTGWSLADGAPPDIWALAQ